jgi:hypothetical protein
MLSYFGNVPKSNLFERATLPAATTIVTATPATFNFDGNSFHPGDVKEFRQFIDQLNSDITQYGRFSVRSCTLVDRETDQQLVFKALRNATTKVQLVTHHGNAITPQYTLHSNEELIAALRACVLAVLHA